MNKSKGWVAIHRSLMDHWLYSQKPFSFSAAFIDLILLANYKDKKTVYRGELVLCERGSVNLSMKELAERWGWGRTKVRTFLDKLEADGMVKLDITSRRTVIRLTNYDLYQASSALVLSPAGTADCAANDASDATTNSKVNGTTNKDYKKHYNTKGPNTPSGHGFYRNVWASDQDYADLSEEEYV